PVAEGVQNWSSHSVMFSLLTRMLYRRGEDLSSSLVMTKGLCMRLPVGRPEAASRGEMMSWDTAITMILPSRPFWVTEPLISPDFCPFSFKYAFNAIIILLLVSEGIPVCGNIALPFHTLII